jgi:chromosome segregation ATPase
MSLFPFVRNFLGVKGDQAAQGVVEALVRLDPDGASQADLRAMEDDLDVAGRAIAKLRADLAHEQQEFDAINKQYTELMAAAELLQKKVDDPTAPEAQKPDVQKSLAKLLDRLEHTVPELDRDKKDVADTQALLAQAEDAYRQKAEALANAKQSLERAKHDLQHAKIEEERAAERARQAEVVAGIRRGSTNGLNVALDSLQKSAEQARQRAEANTMKATALGHAKDAAGDKNIAEALAQVRSGPGSQSLSDRLAALRRS